MAIIAQRIIRRKGSEVGRVIGKVFNFPTLDALRTHARDSRHVYVYLADAGEGTMRSGRKMRPVDAHVRNTVSARVF